MWSNRNLIGAVLALGIVAAASGNAFVAEKGDKKEAKSCCEQQLACCTPKSACCVADVRHGCCEKAMKCCAEKRACCTGVQKCCLEGAACCDQKKACCGPAAGDKSAANDGARLRRTMTEGVPEPALWNAAIVSVAMDAAEATRPCCQGRAKR